MSGFVVNRYAIHHDGILFDKGGEALVEGQGGDRAAGGGHGAKRIARLIQPTAPKHLGPSISTTKTMHSH